MDTRDYSDEAERRRAIEDLSRDVGSMALGVATSMLGSRQAAEDALQDAFVQAYRGLPRYRGDASLKTWFMRILVHSCTRHRRTFRRWSRWQREPDVSPPPTLEGDAPDPALRARIDSAVQILSHRQRTAFVLRYTQDMPIREIAQVMECAEGTVKATIHKAVLKLRVELQDVREESDDQ